MNKLKIKQPILHGCIGCPLCRRCHICHGPCTPRRVCKPINSKPTTKAA